MNKVPDPVWEVSVLACGRHCGLVFSRQERSVVLFEGPFYTRLFDSWRSVDGKIEANCYQRTFNADGAAQ